MAHFMQLPDHCHIRRTHCTGVVSLGSGLRFVALSLLKRSEASDQFQRTANYSTLRRGRERHLRQMERQYHGQDLTFAGALVDEARKRYPKATAAQLLTVARDALRDLLSAALPAGGDASPPAGVANKRRRSRVAKP